ncbi:MAG: urea transporter [Oligoflexia bacterium]|nr:urea transporter [Oligoflexia bacterium]
MAARLIGEAGSALLHSYSQILFAESRWLGASVALASFVHPRHGAMGLLGALLSNALALALGLDRASIRRGIHGYNGVLLGLALGSLFALDPAGLLLLAMGCLLCVMLTAALGYALGQYFGLPALSAPFTLATWLSVLAALSLGGLRPAPVASSWFVGLLPALEPAWLWLPFQRLAAALFQTDAVTGLLLAAGLLLHSRVSVLLMAFGLLCAQLVHEFIGLRAELLEGYAFALSSMFSALALGGIFVVPSRSSFVLAGAGAVLSVVLLAASEAVLPAQLLPLTLPYTLVVWGLLLCLRLRGAEARGPRVAWLFAGSPEANLYQAREQQRRARVERLRIGLPFAGRWKVSQGVDGAHTHVGPWRFAFDFQALGQGGGLHRGAGLAAEDYFAFGMPVLAPADGTTWSCESAIADNPVGGINLERNWGNHVILQHSPGFFSCLAHLKKGSVRVVPGQPVQKGQLLGLCGNSGRSPFPHLHVQFQTQPALGAPALPFSFSDLLLWEDAKKRFLLEARPAEGAVVSNPERLAQPTRFWPGLSASMPGLLRQQWALCFHGKAETWTFGIDPLGRTFLESAPVRTRLTFRTSAEAFITLGLDGSRRTGLWLVGSLLQEVPFIDEPQGVEWLADGSDARMELECRPSEVRVRVERAPGLRFAGLRVGALARERYEVRLEAGQRIGVTRGGKPFLMARPEPLIVPTLEVLAGG